MVEQCLTQFTEISGKLFQLLVKTKKRVKNNQRQQIVHQYCDNNVNKCILG